MNGQEGHRGKWVGTQGGRQVWVWGERKTVGLWNRVLGESGEQGLERRAEADFAFVMVKIQVEVGSEFEATVGPGLNGAWDWLEESGLVKRTRSSSGTHAIGWLGEVFEPCCGELTALMKAQHFARDFLVEDQSGVYPCSWV